MSCWKVSCASAIFCVAVVSASCPAQCRCPAAGPPCAAGCGSGSVGPDGCGCCKVCARQLFEDCSEAQPCDRAKGLECNYGGMRGAAKGICRAKSDGRSCEYNNQIYQNGESFRPNCKHQCTCMDGAVGCVSLCPHVLVLPPLGCANPQRVKVPGGCCDQLVCPEETLAAKKHVKKRRKESGLSFKELARDRNQLSPDWRGGAKILAAFRSAPVERVSVAAVRCEAQTTAWSPCSKSCGTGVSTRLTNSNSQCQLQKETRVCLIRTCNQMLRHKDAQNCKPTEKARRPVKIAYAGCRSLRRFRPKYCGSCSDGRCCEPLRTHTVPVLFQCLHGEITSMMVSVIESCRCHGRCPSGHQKAAAALQRLFKDARNRRL